MYGAYVSPDPDLVTFWLADRIDELLHGVRGSIPGLSVLSCVREAPVAYAEIENGIQYRHLGGLYRLQVRPEEA